MVQKGPAALVHVDGAARHEAIEIGVAFDEDFEAIGADPLHPVQGSRQKRVAGDPVPSCARIVEQDRLVGDEREIVAAEASPEEKLLECRAVTGDQGEGESGDLRIGREDVELEFLARRREVADEARNDDEVAEPAGDAERDAQAAATRRRGYRHAQASARPPRLAAHEETVLHPLGQERLDVGCPPALQPISLSRPHANRAYPELHATLVFPANTRRPF